MVRFRPWMRGCNYMSADCANRVDQWQELGFEKYQTYEIKESTWQKYENGTLPDYVDFTKWVHDLYRPSHRPYDPKEIELIQKYCAMADEDFAKK